MTGSRITIKHLRYLVALAETGHFRRAAERCGISQPSLSVQVQNFEDILGAKLVERGGTAVMLTPVGRDIVARSRSVLLDVQGIVDFAASARQRLAGTIRLGVKPTIGPYLLPAIVARLHRQYPDLKLYIREGAPHRLEAELQSGLHDIILAQLPIQSNDLVTRRLFREPIHLAVSADHPLAARDHITPPDLKGLSVLSMSSDFHLHDQVRALCQEFDARLVQDYEGTSLDALRQMVAMNMGVTFLPALYVRSEIRADSDVVAKVLKGRAISRSIGLVWRKSSGRSGALADLADVIRGVVRDAFEDLILEA